MKILLVLCLAMILVGCETVGEIVTAPLFVAEGIQEAHDRKQTEKQEGHPYGLTDLHQ